MKTKDEIVKFMNDGGELIANEDKLTAKIKGYNGFTEKISYNIYLDLYYSDALKLKTVSSDTHTFIYTF